MTNILRRPEVEKRTGYKRSTIYWLIQVGVFPAPVKIGLRASGWIESEVDEYIANRIKARGERYPEPPEPIPPASYVAPSRVKVSR